MILDEPTAALTTKEIEILFDLMRQLKERGVGMIFISHHLNELAEIGDTVSVLRDGMRVAEVPASTPEEELVKLMVGRPIDERFPPRTATIGEPVLSVKNLSSAGKFSKVSFDVHAERAHAWEVFVGMKPHEVVKSTGGGYEPPSGTLRIRDDSGGLIRNGITNGGWTLIPQ